MGHIRHCIVLGISLVSLVVFWFVGVIAGVANWVMVGRICMSSLSVIVGLIGCGFLCCAGVSFACCGGVLLWLFWFSRLLGVCGTAFGVWAGVLGFCFTGVHVLLVCSVSSG